MVPQWLYNLLAVGKDTIPQVISLQPLLVKVCIIIVHVIHVWGNVFWKKWEKNSNDYTQYLTKVNVCL